MSTRNEHLEGIRRRQRREKTVRRSIFAGLGIIAIGGTVFFAAQLVANDPALNAEENLTPVNALADGSFRILDDGSVDTSRSNENRAGRVRLTTYIDPICPGCGLVERTLGESYLERLKAGELDLYVSPLSFLDSTSTDKYSTRAVNALVTVAEKDPQAFTGFLTAIMAEDAQPAEGQEYVPVTDDMLAARAVSAGVKPEVAETFRKGSYIQWITQNTEKTGKNNEIFPGGLSTPTLAIGGRIDGGKLTGARKADLTSATPLADQFRNIMTTELAATRKK